MKPSKIAWDIPTSWGICTLQIFIANHQAYASLKKFMAQRIHIRWSKFLAKLQLKILPFFFSYPLFQLHPYQTLYSFSVPFINFYVYEYDFRTGSYQHMYASDFPPYKFASFSYFILLNPLHHHLSLSISISKSLSSLDVATFQQWIITSIDVSPKPETNQTKSP